jgi:hypothetical protein
MMDWHYMISSFWLAAFGIILNLIGTVLLVFSLPTFFEGFNPKTGTLGWRSPDKGQSYWQFVLDLFIYKLFKEKDLILVLSLSFLLLGALFQIVSLF